MRERHGELGRNMGQVGQLEAYQKRCSTTKCAGAQIGGFGRDVLKEWLNSRLLPQPETQLAKPTPIRPVDGGRSHSTDLHDRQASCGSTGPQTPVRGYGK